MRENIRFSEIWRYRVLKMNFRSNGRYASTERSEHSSGICLLERHEANYG